MRCEVEEATPSRALRRPEKVTLLLNLRGSVARERSSQGNQSKQDVPGFASLRSARKRRVDVLEKHHAPLRRVRQQVIELVVGEAALGQVQDADVVVERASEGLDEGGFSGSGRAVQEVASPVWDACGWTLVRTRAAKSDSGIVDRPRSEYHFPRLMNALTSSTTRSLTPSSSTTLSSNRLSRGRPNGRHSAPHAV